MNEKKLNSFVMAWLPIISMIVLAITVLIILSIGSGYMMLFANVTSSEITDIEGNCISNAEKLSLIAQKRGGQLHISPSQGKSVPSMQVFSNISTLLLACDSYALDYFCAGEGCSGSEKITADFKKITVD